MNQNLLKKLIEDEKKNDKNLYSAGPYWDYKNSRAILEIKKKGLNNFRGYAAGIGSSFADSLILDIRNELNTKGKIVSKLFSLFSFDKIFSYQLKVTKSHINSYLKNLSIVYKNNQNVLKLIEKYKFENTTEFGCLKKFNLNGKEYSTHYLEMADRIDKLSNKFDYKKINNFFEIGGGFGSNVHFLISNFPNIKKIIYLDIVPNIFVATEYLKFHYGDKVKDYLNCRDLKEISFSKDSELEIICIPPWEIEKLKIKVNHFHNAASFVEMPEVVIKNYCKYIKKFNTKEISLISYDGFNPSTTFNPELLNNYFENNLNISWKDTLIKEYERKLIYLTSN